MYVYVSICLFVCLSSCLWLFVAVYLADCPDEGLWCVQVDVAAWPCFSESHVNYEKQAVALVSVGVCHLVTSK